MSLDSLTIDLLIEKFIAALASYNQSCGIFQGDHFAKLMKCLKRLTTIKNNAKEDGLTPHDQMREAVLEIFALYQALLNSNSRKAKQALEPLVHLLDQGTEHSTVTYYSPTTCFFGLFKATEGISPKTFAILDRLGTAITFPKETFAHFIRVKATEEYLQRNETDVEVESQSTQNNTSNDNQIFRARYIIH
ncbi:MAG: hypothetical protein A3E87_07975 [Gammaproteobacteria bacterium RIFCSPHIGHO2_12_FULL_35_23]|nr:MAG: hypothetical protein A3E87_07975 [Gammaproteobacteria bacterium RIFCSPHIGHO2_12_FULL_35_23]